MKRRDFVKVASSIPTLPFLPALPSNSYNNEVVEPYEINELQFDPFKYVRDVFHVDSYDKSESSNVSKNVKSKSTCKEFIKIFTNKDRVVLPNHGFLPTKDDWEMYLPVYEVGASIDFLKSYENRKDVIQRAAECHTHNIQKKFKMIVFIH